MHQLLTVDEVAATLRRKPATLYLWKHLQNHPRKNRSTPKLRFSKIHGRLLIKQSDLNDFIAEGSNA